MSWVLHDLLSRVIVYTVVLDIGARQTPSHSFQDMERGRVETTAAAPQCNWATSVSDRRTAVAVIQ